MPFSPAAMVKTFETVHPQIIQKSRHARDVSQTISTSILSATNANFLIVQLHPQILDVQITSDSDTYTLRLTLNK